MSEEKIKIRERISYGLGDFAQNGMFTFISSYLMFFLTDAAKIHLGAAGLILLLGRVADALVSPLVGGRMDQKQRGQGKCRPYMRFFILPECVLLMLVFMSPAFSDDQRILYLGLVYILYSITYAIVSVAYSTLMSLLTRNEKERLKLNLFKNIGAAAGGMLVTAVTMKIVNLFSVDLRKGFFAAASIYAAVFFLAGMTCVRNTKERVIPVQPQKLSYIQSFKVTRKSRAWLVLCFINFLEMFYYTMRAQGVMYYSKYYLRQEWVGAILLATTQFVTLAVAFIMPWLSSKIGNRGCVRLGNLIWCTALAGNFFSGRNLKGVLFFGLLSSIGWAAATGILFVMISETIDFSEQITGYRLDGFITSTVVFLMKLGTASAGAVSSTTLALGGYVADGPVTKGIETSIRLNYIGIPLALSLAVILLTGLYPVKQPGKEMSGEIEERRHRD